jgi:hypothetical protein
MVLLFLRCGVKARSGRVLAVTVGRHGPGDLARVIASVGESRRGNIPIRGGLPLFGMVFRPESFFVSPKRRVAADEAKFAQFVAIIEGPSQSAIIH